MIAEFPKFNKLDIIDKKEFERITHSFIPYSDFNFTSLWCFNTFNTCLISQYQNTLMIKMNDYITEEPIYTFIGATLPKKVLQILQLDKIPIKLIPETIVKELKKTIKDIDFIEDRDNFDYIYSIPELVKLDGPKYHKQRNLAARFLKDFSTHTIEHLDILDRKTQEKINETVELWMKTRKKTIKETKVEWMAIQRLFKLKKEYPTINLVTFGIFINKELISFSINEIINNEYAISHFRKADTRYTGIYQYMEQYTAKLLEKHKLKYLNFEQDLGIEGLRKAKTLWRPIKFLKKYIVVPK